MDDVNEENRIQLMPRDAMCRDGAVMKRGSGVRRTGTWCTVRGSEGRVAEIAGT